MQILLVFYCFLCGRETTVVFLDKHMRFEYEFQQSLINVAHQLSDQPIIIIRQNYKEPSFPNAATTMKHVFPDSHCSFTARVLTLTNESTVCSGKKNSFVRNIRYYEIIKGSCQNTLCWSIGFLLWSRLKWRPDIDKRVWKREWISITVGNVTAWLNGDIFSYYDVTNQSLHTW